MDTDGILFTEGRGQNWSKLVKMVRLVTSAATGGREIHLVTSVATRLRDKKINGAVWSGFTAFYSGLPRIGAVEAAARKKMMVELGRVGSS